MEDVNNAHLDAIRKCLEKLNNEKPQKEAGDPQEMVDVWHNFV